VSGLINGNCEASTVGIVTLMLERLLEVYFNLVEGFDGFGPLVVSYRSTDKERALEGLLWRVSRTHLDSFGGCHDVDCEVLCLLCLVKCRVSDVSATNARYW
jgi:hypothetical protein